jgi:hypothetical protein
MGNTTSLSETLTDRDCFKDLGMDKWIILKLILKKQGGKVWIGFL